MGTLDKPTAGTVRVTGIDAARMTGRELSALRASRIGFVSSVYCGGVPGTRSIRW
jgi:putative ABC transport system ATP-binding protein